MLLLKTKFKMNSQLFQDYHVFKRPEMKKSSEKTQVSCEIDRRLNLEPKVRLFLPPSMTLAIPFKAPQRSVKILLILSKILKDLERSRGSDKVLYLMFKRINKDNKNSFQGLP